MAEDVGRPGGLSVRDRTLRAPGGLLHLPLVQQDRRIAVVELHSNSPASSPATPSSSRRARVTSATPADSSRPTPRRRSAHHHRDPVEGLGREAVGLGEGPPRIRERAGPLLREAELFVDRAQRRSLHPQLAAGIERPFVEAGRLGVREDAERVDRRRIARIATPCPCSPAREKWSESRPASSSGSDDSRSQWSPTAKCRRLRVRYGRPA